MKDRNWMGTESLFNPIHRELSVNTTGIGVHSSTFDLIGHEDMSRFKCGEVMKPVPTDLAGRVRSGSGWRERKERKDRNKPKRPLLEPMRTHHMEPCVRIQAWAARPIADLGTYASHMNPPCVRIGQFQHL
ncbi:hypothetical protein PIB30_086081 [Stylosanthes scabra]|uniref:Uncharacterized protein n=1 Tax=Stylosanthes scabra TaxID=79078 RepID=A0ABU6WVT9_9FABA|nr:hypothetical protein [Stylosanthes scabra]